MIITRTPFRVSLFGGGTDFPQYYRKHGGAVLGFALNKYCWISLRYLPPFFEHRHRIVYTRVETVGSVDEIQHPAVRAVLDTWTGPGLEIHHDGDLPARSGLGSSSSFTVGLINALAALEGRLRTKRGLANEAIRIEQDIIGEAVGSQDQIWAAYGGFNQIEFDGDGFQVTPLIVPAGRTEELLDHLLLFFTGFQRLATEIEAVKIAHMDDNTEILHHMREQVGNAYQILVYPTPHFDVRDIGTLLHEAWNLKKQLAGPVSGPTIESIYQAARAAGALGGKLLGAGGGGFFLFFVEPKFRAAVRAALSKLIEVSIGIDREGSRVVLYEPGGLTR